VLFLGRLDAEARYKGTERLLHLVQRLPPDRFEVVMAGKGNDLGHLRGLARALGVDDRASFPGSVHEDHLPALYRSADCFYLVSEVGPAKGEGIPLTPLEAMACGVPVIVGNQDGSREILDGSGGLCCDPRDLERQTAYLVGLRRDANLHRAERAAARRRAELAFGFPAFAEKTLRAIQSLRNAAS
jgi:phosphatidylinositol alpha-1,6-mannosyltransferase